MAINPNSQDSPNLPSSIEVDSSLADAEGILGSQQVSSAASGEGPILLFDGVCNLCDSAVHFVIDHDPDEQFRFVALQSDAARDALERAGAPEKLPDSMVLIDDRGVHTRSDAALAVARRLSFPWSLLAVTRVVPRFVRDPLYAWIARHRYRWFGRQTTCRIPTPGLRARFLDADEPVRVPPAVADEPSPAVVGLGLGTLLERFILIYPILFMLPILTMGLHAVATQPIIGWMGKTLTGEVPSFAVTGSGDGLASYLGVLLNLFLAASISFGWWLWRRSKPVSSGVADACRVLLRYCLVSVMLSFGIIKLFPLQMPMMGPDRLLQPFGDSSPMGLLWTFMGASPGYQMFAGAAEVLGGLLLLFRRTTLLGALVIAAVMTNVFAMNMFFDVPVKIHSFHYLLFAIVLILPDAPRLAGFFVVNVPVAPRDQRPFWHGSHFWRQAAGIAKLVVIAALLLPNIAFSLAQMYERGPWAPQSELQGLYRVESFTVSSSDPMSDADADAAMPDAVMPDEAIPDDQRWVRVGINAPYTMMVVRADGTATRLRMTLDEEASTVALLSRGMRKPAPDPLTLERLEDGGLRLTGEFEESSIDIILRVDETESVIHSRPFRWINEFPFNR